MASTLILHHGHDKKSPAITGCPFPSEVDLSCGARLTGESGRTGWAQASLLTGPTTNGVRWWELSFLSEWEGEVTAAPAESAASTDSLASESGNGVELDNGLLTVALYGTGSGDPVSLEWEGGSGALRPLVKTVELGSCVEEDGAVREVRILRNGPVRAQVELRGKLKGESGGLDYRLTIELWQGWPAARIDWMITHACPGQANLTVTEATLVGNWQVGAATERVFRQRSHGIEWQPRDVINPAPVTLIADHTMNGVHVADPAMLLDDTNYPFYCAPPLIPTGDWLELRGSTGRISARVVDFAQTQPNALASTEQELSYHLVPPGSTLTWSQGWRKEQTLLIAVAPRGSALSPAELAGQASALFAPGRAQPAPATLRDLGCFELDRIMHHIPGRHLRMSGLLNQLCELQSRGAKMDLGDTPDWHYTRGYATGPNQYMPIGCFENFPRSVSHTGYVFPDQLKYFVEPVWTNNEYDVVHTLATQVMRTGTDDHFRMLRWAARHNVEIDFLSYSDDPWHHRASPFHSHFHNRKGAITSHFWTQGLLQYYCLTGDRDALETALALGDKIIEVNHNATVRQWKFDREIGWALLALCCLVEAGENRYLEEASSIATYLQGYDRQGFAGAVNLSLGKAGRSLERQMIDNAFGYSSMVEALDRYQSLAGDDQSRRWFEQLLSDLKDAFWQKIEEGEAVSIRSMLGVVMAIGFERTGDKDYLLAGQLILERWLDPTHANPTDISMSAGTEAGQAKPCAMAYRGLHRLLGALDREERLDIYEYPALREHRDRLAASKRTTSS